MAKLGNSASQLCLHLPEEQQCQGWGMLPTMPKSQVNQPDPFEWCRATGKVTLPTGGASHVPLHVIRSSMIETYLR